MTDKIADKVKEKLLKQINSEIFYNEPYVTWDELAKDEPKWCSLLLEASTLAIEFREEETRRIMETHYSDEFIKWFDRNLAPRIAEALINGYKIAPVWLAEKAWSASRTEAIQKLNGLLVPVGSFPPFVPDERMRTIEKCISAIKEEKPIS